MAQESFIQVRVKKETKKEAQDVLESLGLDLSTAVKILCKQIIHTGTFPLEIRDLNGMRPGQAAAMRRAMAEAKRSAKSVKTARAVMRDLDK